MTTYKFSEQEKMMLESIQQPYAVFQYDNKVIPLALSEGFVNLFGYNSKESAKRDLIQNNTMYLYVHPDDLAKVEGETYNFIVHDEKYDIVYHSRNNSTRDYKMIHSQGKKFGVFINPAVSLDVIRPYAHLLDRLLIMTVDPGFAGQPFVEYSLKKIRQACEWRKAEGYTYEIACDGCCNEAWYGALYSAGCDVFIVGNSGLFNKDRKDTAHALTVCLENIECAIRKEDSRADE